MKPAKIVKDSNIVKIAVEMHCHDKVVSAQLIELNQSQPLPSIIKNLCDFWGLPDPDQYELQFSETNNRNYITEKNRWEIKHGSYLRLELSAAKKVEDVIHKIRSGTPEEKVSALKVLASQSGDITFASEFINKEGLPMLIQNIEKGSFEGVALTHALVTFGVLMDHGIISWDILENSFVSKIASFVNQSSLYNTQIVQTCLTLLENVVLNTSNKYPIVEREIPIPNLTVYLQMQTQDTLIKQNTLSLINALFLKADLTKKKMIAKTLLSKQVRNIICDNISKLNELTKDSVTAYIGTEMKHQLYVLQTLCFNLLEERMNCKMDINDQDAIDKLKELRRCAFESDIIFNPDMTARRQMSTLAKDHKRLGFKNENDPSKDFSEAPPGLLALDCMVYFARNYPDDYTKIVLENSCRADEHECPFGQTSIELVKLLCEILHIGEPPSEQGQTYQAMFFTHDNPFLELFSVCIVLLNKTWKEMRATMEDFTKVLSVVREQITRVLLTTPPTFETLKTKINQLTYSEITQIWQQERTNREVGESHARPIKELKEKITPEIIDLIQQHRLGVLVNGTRFRKYKGKYWYVRLSPNNKFLHYGDCDEKMTPSLEELNNEVAVSDIQELLVGKECPHTKDVRGRKTTPQLAFSIMLKTMKSLDFIAPDEQVFDFWTDGVNVLLKKKMTSKSFESDFETLLSMDIKIRLLDAEGIDIPQDPPPIPEEPDNYNFYYDPK